jgi:hypothetical protein
MEEPVNVMSQIQAATFEFASCGILCGMRDCRPPKLADVGCDKLMSNAIKALITRA